MALFKDREAAARQLIGLLPPSMGADWLVLALPRGGVPLAAVIAQHLGAPMDVLIVRKVGAPGNPELALAAVTGPNPEECAANESLQRALGLDDADVHRLAREPIEEVARRREAWASARPALPIKGRNVLIVDDGVATGTTLAAAVSAAQRQGARKVAIAVPVALGNALERFRNQGLSVYCLHPEAHFSAVGQAYDEFPQISNERVRDLLTERAITPSA